MYAARVSQEEGGEGEVQKRSAQETRKIAAKNKIAHRAKFCTTSHIFVSIFYLHLSLALSLSCLLLLLSNVYCNAKSSTSISALVKRHHSLILMGPPPPLLPPTQSLGFLKSPALTRCPWGSFSMRKHSLQ